jgi:hypothetical protein
MFQKEYGFYQIRAFKHCQFFYLNFVRQTPTRRPVDRHIRSVVGDAVHEVVNVTNPQEGDRTIRERIERRLPPQLQPEALVRAKKHARVSRQVVTQHPGKVTRRHFRWRDDGPGGLGCLIYTTPDLILEDGNVWTIVEVKTGDERNPLVRQALWDHLRFHGIVAASSFDPSSGPKPRIHLVGYATGEQLIQVAGQGKPVKPDLSKRKPTFSFGYSWDFLKVEQKEVRDRIRPIMAAEEAGKFPACPTDSCVHCDYLWTGNCIEGQEHVRRLEELAERRMHRLPLEEIARIGPRAEDVDHSDDGRKQA